MAIFKWLRGTLGSGLVSPPIPEAIQEAILTALAACSRQVEESLGAGFERLPWISDRQDDIAATYAIGFLQGSLLSIDADLIPPDEGVDARLTSCAAVVVTGLFEFKNMTPDQVELRVAACKKRLPQFRGAKAQGEWSNIEMRGKLDAMALAEGQPMPEGGYLRMLLDGSITSKERELLPRSA